METLTRRDLETLLAHDHPHCVSLYMPTHRTGPEIREHGTRFSNLIRRTEEALRAKGVKGLKLQQVLDSLGELRHDGVFWQNQFGGLAIFFDDGERWLFRLPLPVKEQVVVGPRFHVRPLLPLIQGDGRFYVLVVSQNAVRLFEGSRFAVNELQDDRLPKNLREALNIDEYVQSLQFNSTSSPQAGGSPRGTAGFHGQGGSNVDVKKSDELIPYFRVIDQALQEMFGPDESPLVFAGVEYLFPLFKEASQYNNLVDEPVTGNFDIASPDDLHAQAWPLVEGRFHRIRNAELERLYTPQDPRPHSTGLAEILAGAHVGRVETLFLAEDRELFGHFDFDDETGKVRHPETEAGDGEDLLNAAAVETLRTGGKVFTMPADRLPNQSLVAARFRWAVEPAPAS